MPNSILQILQILGFNKVHVMYDGDQIKIKSLITIQDFRFVGSNKLNQRKDDLVLVRNFLLELSDNNCGPQYIYLVRDTALFRPMHRINSFLKKLKKIDFILVNPEELSLIDQINLLRNAKIVVSESGAALTNILLLPKTCKVVEIHPMKNKAGLWGEMAAVFGIELRVIYGKPMKLKNLISGVGPYRVNQRKTILLLKALKIETENVRNL
jgi:capsular polysaccharide biosynthesis protein